MSETIGIGLDLDQHYLRKLATSFWQARVLHAAVNLEIFEALGESSNADAGPLAKKLGVDSRALEILLSGCCALGLLLREGAGYSNSPLARRYLLSRSPDYQGDMIRMYAGDYATWQGLETVVKQGSPPEKKQHFRPGSPEWFRFMEAMYNTGIVTSRVLVRDGAVQALRPTRLLDVGGGPGAYSIEFVQRYPDLSAFIFDLEGVREAAARHIERAGLGQRITFVAGDYESQSLPSIKPDLVLLSNILHANSLDQSKSLLKKVYEVLVPGGHLLINDFFLSGDKSGPEFAALFGVNMLLSTREGRTYSVKEIRFLVEEAGFTQVQFRDLPSTPYQTALGKK